MLKFVYDVVGFWVIEAKERSFILPLTRPSTLRQQQWVH